MGATKADRAIGVLELLVEAVYSSEKQHLLTQTNREIEVLRWLVPVTKNYTAAERREAIERIKKLSKGLSLGDLKIRDLINEGRR